MNLLKVKDLHATVDGHEILKGVDLTINAGEVHSIMGPNGSARARWPRCWPDARPIPSRKAKVSSTAKIC
jgi:ABC-type histidine transport system ATPase subunit